jgi:hypothetical protein
MLNKSCPICDTPVLRAFLALRLSSSIPTAAITEKCDGYTRREKMLNPTQNGPFLQEFAHAVHRFERESRYFIALLKSAHKVCHLFMVPH